jgi:hypothetical protein
VYTLPIVVPEIVCDTLESAVDVKVIVSAVKVPFGAVAVFDVTEEPFILLHAAFSNCSLYCNKL